MRELVNGMSADDLADVVWRKSRRSNSQGNCAQFAQLGAHVALRDSKDPHGPALIFDAGEVAALVSGLKSGAYDHLLTTC